MKPKLTAVSVEIRYSTDDGYSATEIICAKDVPSISTPGIKAEIALVQAATELARLCALFELGAEFDARSKVAIMSARAALNASRLPQEAGK